MKKFAVFSGFLGAGKTTAMIALIRYHTERRAKAAMISNDLGEGVTLADHRFARLSGVNAAEITDECICFCPETLAARLDAFYDEGCELVVSDIPGFGVGALEHVYHGLSAAYPGQFELAPFTVLVEPRSVALLRGGQDCDAAHILRAQLIEADLIVLNKCDLLSPAAREVDMAWLAARFPEAEILPLSALKGEGLEALSRTLSEGRASLRHPAIDYEDEGLQEAMGRLTEYYLEYRAQVCCRDFDGTTYLRDMAEQIRTALRDEGFEVPHLKLLAWEPEGDFGKVDVLGAERPIEITRRFARPCADIAVVLNANAACPAERLDEILMEAVLTVSRAYQLELAVYKKNGFNLGE